MKRMYLIRHCQAAGQEPDAPLTEEGKRQAEQLAAFLIARGGAEALISSPYVRAMSTIRPLADRLGLPVREDERLRERVLSGTPLDHWRERLQASFADLDVKLPGGESSREAMSRGLAVVEEGLAQPERTLALVTHGNLLALILGRYVPEFGYEGWGSLSNPDVYELLAASGEVQVSRIWE